MSEFIQRHEGVDYIHDDYIDQYLISQEQDYFSTAYDYLRQHVDWGAVAQDSKTNWTVVTLDIHSDDCIGDPDADHDEGCLVGDYWTQDL